MKATPSEDTGRRRPENLTETDFRPYPAEVVQLDPLVDALSRALVRQAGRANAGDRN